MNNEKYNIYPNIILYRRREDISTHIYESRYKKFNFDFYIFNFLIFFFFLNKFYVWRWYSKSKINHDILNLEIFMSSNMNVRAYNKSHYYYYYKYQTSKKL